MPELDFQTMPKWMPEALQIMAMIDTWARAYQVPREAILHQIPYAYGWAQSNPKKAPKKQILRFLFTWMRTAQANGNLRVPEPKRVAPLRPDPAGYEASDADRREMHDQKKAAIGCRTQDCEFCHV